MNAATMNGSTFNLKDNSSGLLVPGTVSYNNTTRTLSFTADVKLNRAVTYTAAITTAGKDLAGNALAAPLTWSFTTTTTGSSSTVSNF